MNMRVTRIFGLIGVLVAFAMTISPSHAQTQRNDVFLAAEQCTVGYGVATGRVFDFDCRKTVADTTQCRWRVGEDIHGLAPKTMYQIDELMRDKKADQSKNLMEASNQLISVFFRQCIASYAPKVASRANKCEKEIAIGVYLWADSQMGYEAAKSEDFLIETRGFDRKLAKEAVSYFSSKDQIQSTAFDQLTARRIGWIKSSLLR
jgi:hypothetical protein